MRPTACTASVCTGMPRPAAIAASSPTGWIAPVSLFASISAANRVSSRNVAAMAVASARPSASTGTRSTAKPDASSRATGSTIAGCSIGPVTTCPGEVSAPARPKTARLFDSVPPEVKITSDGSAPRIRATVSLACSHARRADRPNACRLSAFPPARKCGRIASRTSGSIGVVALWSR